MLRAAAALLLLIPLFDLVLLVVVSRFIGLVPTVLLVVLTALVGLMLARAAGRRNLRKIEAAVGAGEVPTDHVLDGAFILAAGVLFLTPGLFTDAVALAFVLGPTRWPIRVALKRWLIVPYLDRKTGGLASGTIHVGGRPPSDRREAVDIDIEVEDVDEGTGDSKP